MLNNRHHHHQHHQIIKEEPSVLEEEYNSDILASSSSSELFKSNFMESNQGWNQQQTPPESFALSPSPNYDSFNHYEAEEEQDSILATAPTAAAVTNEHNNNRVHLRHFSANDSHCIRNNNTSYLASPSSSTFTLQQQNTHNIPQLHTDEVFSKSPTSLSQTITKFDKKQRQQR